MSVNNIHTVNAVISELNKYNLAQVAELAEKLAMQQKESESDLRSEVEGYDRKTLIDIATKAITVPMDRWRNRDTHHAIVQAGECLALLRSGVPFAASLSKHKSINVDFWGIRGFSAIEVGDDEYLLDGNFYLPLPSQLKPISTETGTAYEDWY